MQLIIFTLCTHIRRWSRCFWNKHMFPVNWRQMKVKKKSLYGSGCNQRCFLFTLICLCVQAPWRCVYYTVNWYKMLSLPGGDEGNEKHQVAFDAWGRQESLLNAAERSGSADKMSFSVYFIIGPPLTEPLLEPVFECVSYYCERLDVSVPGVPFYNWSTKRSLCGDHTGLYLALNLPRFGDGRQVTGSHHHGPGNTTHDWDLHVCTFLVGVGVCVSVPTWQSPCVWSPASCTWSSRSRTRRSWTDPRSSGTLSSFCTETNQGSDLI